MTNDTNEENFSMADTFSKKQSLNSKDHILKNIDPEKINSYTQKQQESKERNVVSGQTESLVNLINEDAKSEVFKDERGIFQKTKDFILSMSSSIQGKEYIVKSGKLQEIEKQLNALTKYEKSNKTYVENNNSALSKCIIELDRIDVEKSLALEKISNLENALVELKDAYTPEFISLIETYSQTNDVSLLESAGVKTDIKSIQDYKDMIRSIDAKEYLCDIAQGDLDNLNNSYDIQLQKKLITEENIAILKTEKMEIDSLKSILEVDARTASQPSISIYVASQRVNHDGVYSYMDDSSNLETKQIDSYNAALRVAGSSKEFGKKYLRNLKKKPRLKL